MATNIESQMKAEVPPQQQEHQPGSEAEMTPAPIYLSDSYKAAP